MNEKAETKPNVEQAVPFFAVSDMQVSLRYYVDGLGFKMTNLEFESDTDVPEGTVFSEGQ